MAFLTLLAASFLVPLESSPNWVHLDYSMMRPKNTLVFENGTLKVVVEKSASPLFYKVDPPVLASGVSAAGNVSRLPALPDSAQEGWNGTDDFGLRLGLVSQGERRFSWLQRLFLPRWLSELASLAGEKGLGAVRFYSISQRAPAGTVRTHPKHEFMQEQVALQMSTPGDFSFEAGLPEPRPIVALWIQCDGDDTKSSFVTRLDRIALLTPSPPVLSTEK